MNDDKIKMQKYFLNVLRGKIDVLSFKLNFEHTPSVLKRIVESKSEDMFKYICKLGWMDNYWTNREIYESLFFKSKESKDFVDCFMTKMIKYLDLNKLDKDKYITLIEQNSLDNFVKTLNFDVLNKKMEHINMQNKSSKKIKL